MNIRHLKNWGANHWQNIQGWRTNRKIVVIESDDWGSIRMPSREVYETLLKKGVRVDQCPFTKYDALASDEDLAALFDVLTSVKSSDGKNPVITANTIVANPNFEKIKQSNYTQYHCEYFTETLRSLLKTRVFSRLLYIGRLEINQKRVDLLLQIWRALHEKLSEWEFWVVGHGSEESQMKQYCLEYGLTRVKFFGKQKPDEYYLKAKILHLTSEYEGFGNVLVEAQSYGCVPMLFDSYSAASEIINHKIDGVLIEPFNVDEYVDKTITLVNSPKLLQQMTLNTIANSKKYNYEKTYNKWINVLNNMTVNNSIIQKT